MKQESLIPLGAPLDQSLDHSRMRQVCQDLEKRLDELLQEKKKMSDLKTQNGKERDLLLREINLALDEALNRMNQIRHLEMEGLPTA